MRQEVAEKFRNMVADGIASGLSATKSVEAAYRWLLKPSDKGVLMEGKTVTSPMKIGPGAYLAMASIYMEYAKLVRTKPILTQSDKEKLARLLEDAGNDYEMTAADMTKPG